jgi:hypothetical protein
MLYLYIKKYLLYLYFISKLKKEIKFHFYYKHKKKNFS